MNKEHRKIFSGMFVLLAFSIVLYWVLFNISDVFSFIKRVIGVFSPIIYGFCIAYVINVFMSPFEKLWDKVFPTKKSNVSLRIKRIVCLLLSLSLVMGVLSSILFLIVPKLIEAVTELFGMLPQFFEDMEKLLISTMDKYNIELPYLHLDILKIQDTLFEILPKIGTDVVNITIHITSSIFSAVFDLLVTIVFSIYMLFQKEKLCRSLKKLLFAIIKEEHADNVMSYLRLTNQTFTSFIRGQITEALIIGVLCFIGMTLLKMPYALIVSVLVSVTALIPVLGAYIGAFIGAFLIVIVSPLKALWFLVFLVILQQLEGNLIYPKVVGKSVGLPGIYVLAAVTVGGSIFGIAGMLIGVPLTSVLYTVTKQFVDRKLNEKHIRIS